MAVELREDTAASVLTDLGVLPAGARATVRSLSGGVANTVLAVRWDGGEVVVKQALAKLRVAADWDFDPSRTTVERDCLLVLERVLPAGSVPAVLAFDETEHLLVIAHAPAGATMWKTALLAGAADPAVGARVGALLGAIHGETAGDDAVRERFSGAWPLVQGRVDPFHRTAADAHPELRDAVLAEVDRLLATRTALVLGDCSPKNVLAYPDRVVLLDFEVAHWGDPAFDVAFMLTHLVLKARHRPEAAAELCGCAGAFLDAYRGPAGAVAPPDHAVVAELGCLLLSRVDGKSPAEYLTTDADRDAVRAAARDLLLGGERPLGAALDAAFDGMRRGRRRRGAVAAP